MTKWKWIVDTKLTDDEVSEYVVGFNSNSFTGIKWHPEQYYFTGNANGNTIPSGATELIPTKWKWHIDFENVNDSDAFTIFLWHIKVLKAGLETMGHTDVSFNYEGNYFTGCATEEIEFPPDAIIL